MFPASKAIKKQPFPVIGPDGHAKPAILAIIEEAIASGIEDVGQFGCAGGIWHAENTILSITEFAEKPSLEYARNHLLVDGLEDGRFLTVFGQYVLKPEIFEILEENIRNNVRERGEFQLTSCLDRMRQEDGFMGLVIQGRRFDIGLPDAYRETVIEYRDAWNRRTPFLTGLRIFSGASQSLIAGAHRFPSRAALSLQTPPNEGAPSEMINQVPIPIRSCQMEGERLVGRILESNS